ncbi:hypothetical protein [Nocardioides sp. 1609]|uniref:hypothetical protein n=1 Tax=Nocardioides sp. 1609 TaxID=2508327 RepID=UPI00106FB506|nr:hypothetical protein [Nocardioides sp. 1609]
MAPLDAFNYTFSNQYRASTRAARIATTAAVGDFDWEWAWVSLLEPVPTKQPEILALRWQVQSTPGELADGEPAPQIGVSLSVAIKHEARDDAPDATSGTADSASRPIVVERTVVVRGFKPQGGPQWWPAIGVQTSMYFGGKCAPVNGSILTPSADPKIVAADLRAFRNFVKSPEVIDPSARSNAEDVADYVDKYCDN